MSRFVRSSKYRHVFGRGTKKELCYDNLRISKNAWDSNIVKVNPTYLSVNWEASGGGAFAVIPLSHRGRVPEQIPIFRGHTSAVLDTDFSPFNDSLIASGSDDGKVFIWQVPDNFSLVTDDDEVTDVSPAMRLAGHTRKVGHVLFHPAAENVLASSSGDFSIKIWDIAAGSPNLTLDHGDIVQSMSYSTNGSLMVTTCRDKKLRVWDLRQQKPAHEVPGHAGAKNSRSAWLTGDVGGDKFATTGFSKMSDRQLGLWDLRTISNGPVGKFQSLDSISGVCIPFWDEGTKCLYLAGRGDGNIRYYELENDTFVYLSEHKSGDPQRGIAFMPKRGVAVNENEVMRAYKTVNDNYIEPISFIVPRRAETFAADIYPPAVAGKPALTAGSWFNGEDGTPPLMDLSTLYAGDAVPQTPVQKAFVPTSVVSPPPTKAASAPAPKPAPVPEPAKAPEEPVKTSPPAAQPAEAPKPPASAPVSRVEAAKSAFTSTVESAKSAFTSSEPPQSDGASTPKAVAVHTTNGSTPTSSATGDKEIKEQLARIMGLMEAQGKKLDENTTEIKRLSKEVDTLRLEREERAHEEIGKKDEIIRKLELELEEARS